MQPNEIVHAAEFAVTTHKRALDPATLSEARQMARDVAASRLFGVKSESEALVIMVAGRELGLSAMQSLRGIHVIEGKVSLSADMAVAIIRQSGLCEVWRVVESTDQRCTIETRRKGEQMQSLTWTMDDAKRADLAGKNQWKKYPRAMLRHRCSTELGRMVYEDVLSGVYCEDEAEEFTRRVERADVSLVDAPQAQESRQLAEPAPPYVLNENTRKWLASDLAGLLDTKTLQWFSRRQNGERAAIWPAYVAALTEALRPLDLESLRSLWPLQLPAELLSQEYARELSDLLATAAPQGDAAEPSEG